MPRPQQPVPLIDSCVRCVAANENLWGSASFCSFPAPLMEKILNAILTRDTEEDIELEKIRNLVIRSGKTFMGVSVNRLKLSEWKCLSTCAGHRTTKAKRKLDKWFNKFLRHCRNLADLDMTGYCEFLSKKDMPAILKDIKVDKLRSLNVSGLYSDVNHNVSTDIMKILRKRCSGLRKLILRNSPNVSDNTMIALFGASRYACLNELKFLDVRGTVVGTPGVACILKNAQSLTHFYHSQMYLVVAVAHRLVSRNIVRSPLSLQYLFIDCVYSLNKSVACMANLPLDFSMFSNATHFAIILRNNEEHKILAAMAQLKKLTKFTLNEIDYNEPYRNSYDLSHVSPFEPYISSFIENIGPQLTELSLSVVDEISFLMIGQYCPKLLSLTADFITTKREANYSGFSDIFKTIETLELSQQGAPKTGLAYLIPLLSPMHNLRTLKLNNLGLDESFFEMLILCNPLSHLEVLEVSSCCTVTGEALVRFIASCPKLKDLTFDLPRGVYQTDEDHYAAGCNLSSHLEQTIEQEGWDLDAWVWFLHRFLM